MTAELRRDIPPPPVRCASLPVDPDRGYPVPWFVEWIDGKPDFRIVSMAKVVRAWNDRRCWVCGGPLGRYVSFVAGPMCGLNRTSSEPPAHRECAVWSGRACPFLTRPHAVRRAAGLPVEETKPVGGIMLSRNPGVAMIWTTRNPRVFEDGRGGFLFHMGEPTDITWLCEGRLATAAEVEASIDSGFPALVEVCRQDENPAESEAALRASLESFRVHLPK